MFILTVEIVGCWEISGKPQDCERSQCVSDTKPSKAMNNTKFCCCSGDYCNGNFTYVPVADDVKPASPGKCSFTCKMILF